MKLTWKDWVIAIVLVFVLYQCATAPRNPSYPDECVPVYYPTGTVCE